MLHYFNPGHEAAVLCGSPYYTPPKNVLQLQRDLSFLPAWYAADGDFVWVEELLPAAFEQELTTSFQLKVSAVNSTNIASYKELLSGSELQLWGISPEAIRRFEMREETDGLKLTLPEWNPALALFCHRKKASEWLSQICQSIPEINPQLLPRFFGSLNEVEQLLEEEKEALFLAKAPYSSSGRGLLWLPKESLTRSERQILQGIINKQETVALEYVRRKKLDFAMEFMCRDGACSFLGYSLFETDQRGAYRANRIATQKNIEQEIIRTAQLKQLLEKTKDVLIREANKELPSLYKGFFGVDMMLYEDEGELRLHPCVELNLRSNMGILALGLEKYIAAGSQGCFRIEYLKSGAMLMEQHRSYEKRYPRCLSEGKIVSGYLPLCPPRPTGQYWAYVLVSEGGPAVEAEPRACGR